MFDLAVVETFNGGDVQLDGRDLAQIYGTENMGYLAMFGGNPGYPTKPKPDEEFSKDWWGNGLLMANNPLIQFNSLTEYKLRSVPLTSSGRVQIEESVKKDLEFLNAYGKVTVSVSIISDDKLSIEIKFILTNGTARIKVVNFRKKIDGDFYFEDFNGDFFI